MTRDRVGSVPTSGGDIPISSFLKWLDATPLQDWQKAILEEWEGKMASDILEYIAELQNDPISDIECDFEDLIADIKNV